MWNSKEWSELGQSYSKGMVNGLSEIEEGTTQEERYQAMMVAHLKAISSLLGHLGEELALAREAREAQAWEKN